jgi:S-adenosylmethionine/arginine decarboxylase-like enzyme
MILRTPAEALTLALCAICVTQIAATAQVFQFGQEEVERHVRTRGSNVISPPYEYERLIGSSLVCEFVDVEHPSLNNAEVLLRALEDAAAASNLTVISRGNHQFEGKGEGATAYLLLAESHISAHTWQSISTSPWTCSRVAQSSTACTPWSS